MTPEVFRRSRAFLPVLLCTLTLPLLALVVRPSVAMGIIDDWSYIRSAEVLARTGHIVYNGWATAMLGWQLYLGALIIKLFGFSFTAPRMATLLVATVAAALLQRLYVRLGLSEWNSAAGTLIFLASPIWMASTFSFMSDVYGMLVLLGCCYGCVRSLQAKRECAATAWICATAIGTGLGGTARQIAWLGVLVMVPCTLWLLRRNRSALRLGSVCTVLGIACVPLSLWWFNHQPYSLPEPIMPPGALSIKHLLRVSLPDYLEQVGFELLLLTAPLLLCLLGAALRSRRALIAIAVVLVYWAWRMPRVYHDHYLWDWAPPYMVLSLNLHGWQEMPSYLGQPALLLTTRVRLVLAALVLLSELALIGLLVRRRSAGGVSRAPAPVRSGTRQLSTRELAVLLAPTTLAYLLLLLPRFLTTGLFDRYMMAPEAVLLGVTIALYQRRVKPRLPAAVWALTAAALAVNTAGMRDAFNLFRAQAALLQHLQNDGVPRTELDGGFAFNGWTEILAAGYVNDARIRIPAGAYQPVPKSIWKDPCRTPVSGLMPAIHARYVVSFQPAVCGGPTGYQESFSTWLGPRQQTMYAVRGPE